MYLSQGRTDHLLRRFFYLWVSKTSKWHKFPWLIACFAGLVFCHNLGTTLCVRGWQIGMSAVQCPETYRCTCLIHVYDTPAWYILYVSSLSELYLSIHSLIWTSLVRIQCANIFLSVQHRAGHCGGWYVHMLSVCDAYQWSAYIGHYWDIFSNVMEHMPQACFGNIPTSHDNNISFP